MRARIAQVEQTSGREPTSNGIVCRRSTCATPCACSAASPASPPRPCSRSRSASAPTPRSSPWSRPCCCGRCRIPTPTAGARQASRHPHRPAKDDIAIGDFVDLRGAAAVVRRAGRLLAASSRRSSATASRCASRASASRRSCFDVLGVQPAMGRVVRRRRRARRRAAGGDRQPRAVAHASSAPTRRSCRDRSSSARRGAWSSAWRRPDSAFRRASPPT